MPTPLPPGPAGEHDVGMLRPYSFGWVPDQPDARDFRYSAPDQVLAALPSSVDLRPKFTTPAMDQGSIGSCGPHTAAADILYDQQQTPAPDSMPSRLFVYYNTRKLMGTVNEDSGVSNREMLKALAQYGWCDETLCPYDTSKFTQEPSQACYAQARDRLLDVYLRVPQDLDQMRACLAQGDPFIFGFSVHKSLMNPGVAQSGDVPDPGGVFDQIVGGHDVLICGYRDDVQRFIFRNSWGNWGKSGHGTISYAYATDPRQAGDFWTIRWRDRVAPTPPAPTPPAPVPPGPQPPEPPTPAGAQLILPKPLPAGVYRLS